LSLRICNQDKGRAPTARAKSDEVVSALEIRGRLWPRIRRPKAALPGQRRIREHSKMDSSFGVFDAFAFVVFAVLIVAAVVVIVSCAR
jgi:hypothetical protein